MDSAVNNLWYWVEKSATEFYRYQKGAESQFAGWQSLVNSQLYIILEWHDDMKVTLLDGIVATLVLTYFYDVKYLIEKYVRLKKF